jgi:hypothetical protein
LFHSPLHRNATIKNYINNIGNASAIEAKAEYSPTEI